MGMENMHYDYGYNQPVSKSDPELEKISQKNWLDVQKQAAIENIKSQGQAEREWQKMCSREARKENELAQYQEVIVDVSGEIYCITKNLNIRSEKRRIFNFKVKGMIRVVSVEGDSGIWIFRFTIGGKEKCCVMEEKHIFDIKYITRKLGTCGGVIYASSPRKKQDYAEKIMSHLMESSRETFTVMKHLGWTKQKNGEFVFIEEEELLWQSFLKKAK